MEGEGRGKYLDPLRRHKQRLMALWRRAVGKRLALRGLKPLTSDTVRDLPTFCISLSSDKAKRRFMQRQAERLNLRSFGFLDAVDGRSISRDEFTARGVYDDALAHRYEKHSLSPTNIALCLSHFQLWKTIADRGHPVAMVLEDDAIFIERHMHALAPDGFPPEWDVVLLDAYLRQKPPQCPLSDGLYSMESYRGGTAAYMISLSGARKLLKITSVPICHPIDGYMNWYNWHRLEHCSPWGKMGLPVLHACLLYPRPVINGSVTGYWRSSIGSHLPDY